MPSELVRAMSESSFYPDHPADVRIIETHISYVFIAGDDVYKVKKPVRFDFLDFTTLEKRKFYCEEEVRLNRRLAPHTYLAVIAVSRDPRGKLFLGEGPEIVDYAVKMKKLPEDKMLKNVLAAGAADEKTMDRLAEKIARFHLQAKTGARIDPAGDIHHLRRNTQENFQETKNFINVTIPESQYAFIKKFAEKTLAEKEALFRKRILEHRIRECHGDLHLDHICVTDEIVIFDCIEFNERFRCGDVAQDVAFLTMDLDFNGYPRLAKSFETAYLRHSGDVDMPQLLNFYRLYYAYVRGKVASFRLRQEGLEEDERNQIIQTAGRYFDLAYRYAVRLEKPAVILTAGLMGSGKSYQARILSDALGAKIIPADALRKKIFHVRLREHRREDFGRGIYSPDHSAIVYEKMLELAEKNIQQNKAVILDASFKKREHRIKARELAQKLGVRFYILECLCSEETARQRLEKRILENDSVSDGRWELFQLQKNDFDPINEMPPQSHFVIDTSVHPEITRRKIIEKIKLDE
jgi:aminoglycoside phosphotransferase family enzyme/predicted kinase